MQADSVLDAIRMVHVLRHGAHDLQDRIGKGKARNALVLFHAFGAAFGGYLRGLSGSALSQWGGAFVVPPNPGIMV